MGNGAILQPIFPVRLAQVFGEYVLDLRQILDRMKLLSELGGPRNSLHIPPQVLPEFDCRTAWVSLVFLSHSRVLEGNFEPTLDRGSVGLWLPLQQGTSLIEDPGLAKGTARDHDPRAPRLALEANCVLRRFDITVAQHRDLERRRNRGDFLPTRRARVHLGARPRMECEDLCTGVLAAQRDLDR